MRPLHVLVLGAHPDDADIKAGGTCSLWSKAGARVKLVSVTDGSAGHQESAGPALAQRRRQEAARAGAVIGAEYEVLDFPDGGLLPTLEARQTIIRLIRSFNPDVVLTHRPNDYHPDHRYTSALVQDAAYLVTVPAICPDVAPLASNPVILYLSDDFKKPVPFSPDVVVDVGSEMGRVTDMLDCHVSQFYEWLPFNGGFLDQVPRGEAERKGWLGERMRRRIRPLAERYREKLLATYGYERGNQVEFVEAFEVSEYGAPLDAAARARLFPFLPALEGPQGPGHAADWPDLRDDE